VAAHSVIRAVHSAVGVVMALHTVKLGGVVPPVPPVGGVVLPPVQAVAVGVAAHRVMRAVHSAVGVVMALHTVKLGGVVPPVPPVPDVTHAAPFQNCPPVQVPMQAPGEAAHKAEHPASDVLMVHWAMVTVVPPVPPPQAVAVGVVLQRVMRAMHSALGTSDDLHWAKVGGVVPPVPPLGGVVVPPVPELTHAAPFQN